MSKRSQSSGRPRSPFPSRNAGTALQASTIAAGNDRSAAHRSELFNNSFAGPALIILFWSILLASLMVLQMCKTGAGFRIWPLGEDRNWLYFLQEHSGIPAQRAFWAVDGRNALAPWWYILAKPLIKDTTHGIYIVRKLVDLLCALSVYALLQALGGCTYRKVAVYISALTVLWTFSENPSQIVWTMLVAASMNVLALACYCVFLNSNRRNWGWFVVGLLLSFIAADTYGLQCGTFIGVFAFSIAWSLRNHLPWRRVLLLGMWDALPFAALLFLTVLVWSTSSTLSVQASFQPTPLSHKAVAAVQSVEDLLWSPAYKGLFTRPWSLPAPVIALFSGAAAIIATTYLLCCRVLLTAHGRCCEIASTRFPLIPAILITVGSLVGPTVALEASNTTWGPGTRTFMVQQIVQPLLIGVALYFVAGSFSRRTRGISLPEGLLFGAAFFAAGMTALGYNHTQTMLSDSGERLEAGLKALVPTITQPTMFVLVGTPAGVSAYNSDIFVKTIYNSDNVNLKVLLPGVMADAPMFTDVIFGPEQRGIYAESTLGYPRFALRAPFAWIPYRETICVSFDGKQLRQIPPLPSYFAGYRVRFDAVPSQPVPVHQERQILLDGLADNWQRDSAEVVGSTVRLQRPAPGGYALIQHRLKLSPNTLYEISIEARSSDPTATLFVDLYNGPSYDAAEQDHVVDGIGNVTRTFTFTIPSGSAAPPFAFLRIVRAGETPVYVGRIKIVRLFAQ